MTAAERAAESRVAQGLPKQVTDPAVIARVLGLVRAAKRAEGVAA